MGIPPIVDTFQILRHFSLNHREKEYNNLKQTTNTPENTQETIYFQGSQLAVSKPGVQPGFTNKKTLNNGLDYFLKLGQIVLNRRVSRPSAVSPPPRGSELGITRSTLPGMGPAAVERAVIFLAKGKGNP